ncbi:MAG: DUF2089 domain-containing protein [Rhodospirillales bacterium]|jgi:hypothetical protein|nr:DUF2089 domain-containing protein [Rhodospirillales bacterium]MDP6804605.1 DUF2089 domain-containing protein [Rhodospirillales bacterium]
MALDWRRLTDLTGGKDFTIERVRTLDDGIAIEGDFAPPPLAGLDADDQAFVAAFIHCHGSIKQMESWFGVSYPTIKGRLKRIADRLDFAEVADAPPPPVDTADVLDRLEEGQISTEEALAELSP